MHCGQRSRNGRSSGWRFSMRSVRTNLGSLLMASLRTGERPTGCARRGGGLARRGRGLGSGAGAQGCGRLALHVGASTGGCR